MDAEFSLFEAICDGPNLHQAWLGVWSGRTTTSRQTGAGVDGVTIADWVADWDARLRDLQADLLTGLYRPSPLLWFEIPRAEPGRGRRLGIPTVTDRVAQRATKNVLEPIWEAQFLSCSHGFRPDRSVFTAVAHVLWHEARGRRWVVDADIAACFDTLEHTRLLDQVARLGDHRVTDLVAAWLDASTHTPGLGVAQGAPLSPLLANIYLHPFDVAMIHAGHALVRYADDFVVLCHSRQEAQVALDDAADVLAGLGLTLNQEKTRLAPFGPGFTFLGAQFDA
jgi:group II intron reverse transcriptase/maturase